MATTAECDKSFSTSYMLLDPEKVSVCDLVRILFSHNVEKRNFVECPEGTTEESFKRRWLIFVSILVQKVLLSSSKPLARFGNTLEEWLNLLSSNRGFFRLAWNTLRGKVIRRNKESENFVSFTGNLDKRVKFLESIKPGDSRYYGALSMMAAKASYENKAYIETTVKNQWKMDFVEFYDFYNEYQEKCTTQAFLMQDKTVEPPLIVLAFRGTEPFDADAWSTDFDLSWYELPGVGNVHGGFMKALGLQKNLGWPKEIDHQDNQSQFAYYALREKIRELLSENEGSKFIVTGHSLGGALAILFPAILALHEEFTMLERLEGIYTFGQPRVGDEKFAEFMNDKFAKHSVRYFRFVYCNDLVPRLPYDDRTLMFKHFGTCLYFNNSYKGKIVVEEPNKNYFSPLYAIPKILNAVWELIRSFSISYTRGAEYSEGGLLRVMRFMGLAIAGVPAHGPQDYINATWLGDPDLYAQPNNPTQEQSKLHKIN